MPPFSYIFFTALRSSNGSLAFGSPALATNSGRIPIDSYHDARLTS